MNGTQGWTLGQTLECGDSLAYLKKHLAKTDRSRGMHPLSLFTFQYSSLAQQILGFEEIDGEEVQREAVPFR